MPRGFLLSLAVSTWAAAQPLVPPAWAYPVPPPGRVAPADDGVPRRVPGSPVTFALSQTRDMFFAPDWHPEDHPPMPVSVARGRTPDAWACGVCHRATGSGGPENANLSGLPREYIVAQVKALRSGARSSALPDRKPQQMMIALAKSVTDEELEAAADYFAAIRPRAALRVVETQTIPTPRVGNWTWVDAKTGQREPLAGRIIELPDDVEAFELRDARATFTTYVPVGSLARGAELASGKARGAPACESCHGSGLKGLGIAPPIAGRPASYAMRQLFEFKTGVRHGANAALMTPVVEQLSLDDLTALAAWLASLPP